MTRLRFLLTVAVVGLVGSSGAQAAGPVLVSAYGGAELSAGDTIPLSAERTLRVIEIRSSTADENSVLVVEPA